MNDWLEKLRNFQQEFLISLKKTNILNTRIVWLGIIGVLLLVFGNVFDGNVLKSSMIDEVPARQEKNRESTALPATGTNDEKFIEEKIARLLSSVKGAGNVMASVTLEGSARQEHAKNITKESKVIEEKDTSGGVRTTSENKESEQILLSKESGTDKPVMVSESKARIKGVLIVAEGANDSVVKANLTKAVETGLGIASYKITVLPQGK